jgi:hypothetical protein
MVNMGKGIMTRHITYHFNYVNPNGFHHGEVKPKKRDYFKKYLRTMQERKKVNLFSL